MKKIPTKIIISAIWLLEIVAFIQYRALAINQNAHNASLLRIDELWGYTGALLLLAILTTVLDRKTARSTNLVAGWIMAGIQTIMFIDGFVEYSTTGFNAITVATIIATAIILWLTYSWKESS